MANKPKIKKLTPRQTKDAAEALEVLFASEYVDRKKLYIANFWRGIFFSAGAVIGAAVVIALLMWILSVFKNIPFVGPVVENIKSSIEQQQEK